MEGELGKWPGAVPTECAVCQQSLAQGDSADLTTTMSCGHSFHEYCLSAYREAKAVSWGDLPCPSCKLTANEARTLEAALMESGNRPTTAAHEAAAETEVLAIDLTVPTPPSAPVSSNGQGGGKGRSRAKAGSKKGKGKGTEEDRAEGNGKGETSKGEGADSEGKDNTPEGSGATSSVDDPAAPAASSATATEVATAAATEGTAEAATGGTAEEAAATEATAEAASDEGSATASLFSGEVLCSTCGTFTHYVKCRLMSKTSNTWRCSKCNCKIVQLYRSFGRWPTPAFQGMSDAAKQDLGLVLCLRSVSSGFCWLFF